MKINIAAGGPAGQYFALLAKKPDPQHEITVHERDPADNTYGWSPIVTEETARYSSFPGQLRERLHKPREH